MKTETEAQKFVSYFAKLSEIFRALKDTTIKQTLACIDYTDFNNRCIQYTWSFSDGSSIEMEETLSQDEETLDDIIDFEMIVYKEPRQWKVT